MGLCRATKLRLEDESSEGLLLSGCRTASELNLQIQKVFQISSFILGSP